MRIALIGHACSPHAGSEPGITWNWATSLAERHDVTLLTHPYCREEVEADLLRHPRPRLRFEYVSIPTWMDPWKPKQSERGIRFHYRVWQHSALHALRRLMKTQTFDLVHHVSWGTLQQPPVIWKCGLPFVWGPVGGGQTWPRAFLDYAGAGRPQERLRRLLVRMTPWNWPVVRAARRADLALATNPETADLLRRIGARRVECFPDSGTHDGWLTPAGSNGRSHEPGALNIVWAGRLEPRKGVPLVLEALAQTNAAKIRLFVAGEGPCREQWEQMAQDLNVADRVEFLGRLPWEQTHALFARSDVFVFPSLRDSFGTVIFEAMARRLPLLTLDHQGVGHILPLDAGIKVPVTEPRETVQAMAAAMKRLADDPAAREAMGNQAAAFVATQNWENRVEQMTRWYEEILRAHRGL